MYRYELLNTIEKLCKSGKGILAADESTGTIGKRFNNINLENTHDNRMQYRDLLFTAPGLYEYISGVIVYEETLFDKTKDDKDLIQNLIDNDIIVGIKVDQGVKLIENQQKDQDGETNTQGLVGLEERCKRYYAQGAKFAKWRSVLKIDKDKDLPSELAINENAKSLANYASICIENGLVPIVEPEILMDGTHTIEESYEVSVKVLKCVYSELEKKGVDIECTLLKPNMVRSGVLSNEPLDYKKIANYTIKAFNESVPFNMPGVVFLSGGMSETEATLALNEINKVESRFPGRLTFSYGRALQSSVIKVWNGDKNNLVDAQMMLLKRARCNSMASNGKYINEHDDGEKDSLHEKNYTY